MAWIEVTHQNKKILVNLDHVSRIEPSTATVDAVVTEGSNLILSIARNADFSSLHKIFVSESLKQIEAALNKANAFIARR